MENIFANAQENKPKKAFTTVRIENEILEKLKKLNKGTPNQAINHLLGNSADQKVIDRIRNLENELTKLQDTIEKLVSYNRLRY